MASTTKTEATNLNVYQRLAQARARFLDTPVKKSGVNRFAEFKYFELEDIVPPTTAIFNDLGLLFFVSFEEGSAVGTLVNTDNPEETIVFKSPLVDLTVIDSKTGEAKTPAGMNSVQALGGSETYQRRYLYMAVLDIVEADSFDAGAGKPDPETGKSAAPKKSNKPASEPERQAARKDLIDSDGEATETQIKAIKNGLKKLRAKDADKYEDYVTQTVKRLKAGLNKTEAEDLLIEIGNKVEE